MRLEDSVGQRLAPPVIVERNLVVSPMANLVVSSTVSEDCTFEERVN